MNKKNKNYPVNELTPYWYNPDIHLIHEIEFNGDTIKNGDRIKIKNDKAVYRFIRLVVNSKTQIEWADVYCVSFGGWRSFRTDRIKGKYLEKKPRKRRTKAK